MEGEYVISTMPKENDNNLQHPSYPNFMELPKLTLHQQIAELSLELSRTIYQQSLLSHFHNLRASYGKHILKYRLFSPTVPPCL
ncbi:hypothetical protein CEXT_488261 [Caerostris extrusa]|uniref:Uncharacterized protein n=1 Tax=Caerostris extrusa TaxID=172846 RepID=A0AAV4XCP0_CAEEX|nr:hypothetical protein CEXT_488261 [Caerostris extrusa]